MLSSRMVCFFLNLFIVKPGFRELNPNKGGNDRKLLNTVAEGIISCLKEYMKINEF